MTVISLLSKMLLLWCKNFVTLTKRNDLINLELFAYKRFVPQIVVYQFEKKGGSFKTEGLTSVSRPNVSLLLVELQVRSWTSAIADTPRPGFWWGMDLFCVINTIRLHHQHPPVRLSVDTFILWVYNQSIGNLRSSLSPHFSDYRSCPSRKLFLKVVARDTRLREGDPRTFGWDAEFRNLLPEITLPSLRGRQRRRWVASSFRLLSRHWDPT